MNSEGSEYPEEGECEKCGERGENRVQLGCRHRYCLGCAAFSYHKFKLTMSKPSLTRCLRCDRIHELSEQELRAITDFTDQVLMPLMREEEDNRSAKSRHDTHPVAYSELSSANKQFKSHEHSVEKVTPVGRGFYSKCESPKSGVNQQYCAVHPEQELNIVCLTCQNTLLCISCIANKRHSNHNIKTIAKGLENVQEQMALARLKGKEQVECLEMLKRRLEDRRTVIQERWDKTTESLRLHFANLVDLIHKKSEETVAVCGQFYEKIMEEVVRDGAKVDEVVKLTKKQLTKLTDLSKNSSSPIDLIRKSTLLIEELKDSREPEVETGEIPHCDADRLIRELMRVSEQMERLEILSQREWRQGMEGSRSEEKLLKENFCKRVKTNMMSLNSSRDKKEKKCTKTEEDEKRNKSKANYKTESSSKLLKVNKAIPAYLLQQDRFNKDHPDCFVDHNPLQSSFKSTSKVLSKSHLPSGTEELRKKEQHRTQIKERLERKTFNGQSKEMRGTTDGMRKKKIPC